MSVDVDGVYAAARKVGPYTAQLLGPGGAEFDAELATALADPPSGPGAERLTALFDRRRETRSFLSAVLADAPLYRPAAEQDDADDVRGGPVGPAGGPVRAASKWKCPECDWAWYRPDASVPVPPCDVRGHAPLVRASDST